MHYDTSILHGAGGKDPITGALSIPIYPASTYHQKDVDTRQEYDYSRSGNPTRKALEDTLAVLEEGAAGFAFASGVAAVVAALTSVLKAGDHVVATENIYGGTHRILSGYLSSFGIEHSFADTCSPEATEAAIRPNTKVLFLESPSNPLLKIIDFEAMAALAGKHKLISMVDNTFLSPYFFRPLTLGIDMSIHSGSKFLGGHSDIIAGAIITRTAELGKAVKFVQNTTGNMLSPENSWLLLRGIKTLKPRMQVEAANALELAEWLSTQTWVDETLYPGLKDHPGHEIIKAQASGYGAVVSFRADTVERARRIMQRVQVWTVAVSLGGVESILSYPAKMSHAAIPKAEREAVGIDERLIRLSAGLEDVQDLIEDLKQAAEGDGGAA
jgi:cysteine-S-conjugate beta-lyase